MAVKLQCSHDDCRASFSASELGGNSRCPSCFRVIDPSDPRVRASSGSSDLFGERPSDLSDAFVTPSSLWELPIGAVLGDRYVVGRKLGSGGMGTVYLADDKTLARQVALKVPHPNFHGNDSKFLARTLNEARNAAKFDDPRICHVYDVGQSNGWHYIVMRYIQGETLDEVLKRRGFEPDEAARFIRSVAETLELAHSKNIMHRDLKPANLMFGPNSEVIVMDFGLARRIDLTTDSTQQSEPESFQGTAAYASPEQISLRFEDLGPGSDIFSLGVIFYRLLAGRLPFQGSNYYGLMEQVVKHDPDPPSKFVPQVGPELDRIVRKAMAKAINDRYPSMLAFSRAIDGYFAGDQLDPRVFGSDFGPPPDEGSDSETQVEILVPNDLTPFEISEAFELVSEEIPQVVVVVPRERVRPPKEFASRAIGMKFGLVEPGSFVMGSLDGDPDEMPAHEVEISRPFYLGRHPVTQDEYLRIRGQSPNHFRDDPRNPVEQVAWLDAVLFCNLLSEKEGLPPFYRVENRSVSVGNWRGLGYRLPTEAEWEFACRAGRNARFGFGDDESRLGGFAWFAANSGGRTHPVGSRRPNAWGFFDMHGNVWEWCWDGYDPTYYEKRITPDPRGPIAETRFRSLRGGNWRDDPANLRSANRIWFEPSLKLRYIGFRVALNADGA